MRKLTSCRVAAALGGVLYLFGLVLVAYAMVALFNQCRELAWPSAQLKVLDEI